MATTKLTLTVDEAVIRKAKRHVKTHGGSLSRAVGQYLASLPGKGESSLPPLVSRLAGVLPANVEAAEYKTHLAAKYRL
jgi:hypothetical protein